MNRCLKVYINSFLHCFNIYVARKNILFQKVIQDKKLCLKIISLFLRLKSMGFFLRFFQLLIQGIEFLVPFINSICRSLVNLLSFIFLSFIDRLDVSLYMVNKKCKKMSGFVKISRDWISSLWKDGCWLIKIIWYKVIWYLSKNNAELAITLITSFTRWT